MKSRTLPPLPARPARSVSTDGARRVMTLQRLYRG
jgi:hypothetical protein